jgi:hypothetical protein
MVMLNVLSSELLYGIEIHLKLNPKPDRNGVTVAVNQNDGIRSLIRTATGFLIAETQNPQLNTSPAAVNDDGLTGDIAAGLRGQKE